MAEHRNDLGYEWPRDDGSTGHRELVPENMRDSEHSGESMCRAGTSEEYATQRARLATYTAAPMFWLSLIFLANTAALIVIWVDVPRVREAYLFAMAESGDVTLAAREPSASLESQARTLGYASLWIAGLLWPIFLIEFLFYTIVTGGMRLTRMRSLACICPPLRLIASNPEMNDRIWLPITGWAEPTDELRNRLEKAFGLPMIFIALMILPILLVEFGLKEQIVERTWLRILLHVSTGVIWFAFALEFIVMSSVAKKKLQYCKKHWLDLAIILLPLISFLRTMRVLRATRLARLAKVQHLTKMGRMYRLRGLAIKAFRALLLFEVIDRVLRVSAERRIELLKETLADKEKEVTALRLQITELERATAQGDPKREEAKGRVEPCPPD
jgi:voltage-gated potassium channel